MIQRPRTIICDIDGTLFKYDGNIVAQTLRAPSILPGVKEKFKEWDIEGCHIVLMTGRRESTRRETERQLADAGIFYDELVMGIGGGKRVLINDKKPDGSITTDMFCPARNEGLKYMALDNPHAESDPDNVIIKPWGSEIIIESNEFYTMKKLFMRAGHRCSLQYHEVKHETLYILSGSMRLWIGKERSNITYKLLGTGASFVVPAGIIHRMESITDCYYLESSTSELDDVVRLDDAYGRC